MLFNSLRFAIFFLVVYSLYRFVSCRWQNRLLLVASYVFYAFWDWRFLSLVVASTFLNYYFGLKIGELDDKYRRKRLLIYIVCLNLAILGFFKYFDFFADNLQAILWYLGVRIRRVTLNIVLPLGISFYTFQAMSYPIDIYRGVIRPTRRFFDFALFIAFFPQLVAGPIERARNLLPQIINKRKITKEQFSSGGWLIFLGLYKKIVIADNLAKIANAIFGQMGYFSGAEALIATYAFAFQVYADFSGYSDMARGLAKLMGFNLMLNFKTPFFARNMYEFWQRWHISLTTWIKEYLFYPLALARFWGRQLKAGLVIVLTWAIMGLWHGAAWRFVLWGVYHGFILVIYSRIKPYITGIRFRKRIVARLFLALQILLVFHLFCVGIIFFAVTSTKEVFFVIRQIVFGFAGGFRYSLNVLALMAGLMIPFLIIEFFQYKSGDEAVVFRWPIGIRIFTYYLILYLTILYGDFGAQRYYYFQF